MLMSSAAFTCFLSVFLHACRALAVCAVITGFFGGVLTLIGMKCTKIGGSEITNARVTFAGGITYLVSGKKNKFFRCMNLVWMLCTQFNASCVLGQDSVVWSPTRGGPTKSYQNSWIQISVHRSEYVWSSMIVCKLDLKLDKKCRKTIRSCDIPEHVFLVRFELGAAVFIGWGGSILLISGGTVMTYFSGKEGLPST